MSNDVNHAIALRALEPLKTERKKFKAKLMYKILIKTGPKSLTNLFSYKSEKTNYQLRNISSSFCLPKPSTNNMNNSFMYDGTKLWNSIPRDIIAVVDPAPSFRGGAQTLVNLGGGGGIP